MVDGKMIYLFSETESCTGFNWFTIGSTIVLFEQYSETLDSVKAGNFFSSSSRNVPVMGLGG